MALSAPTAATACSTTVCMISRRSSVELIRPLISLRTSARRAASVSRSRAARFRAPSRPGYPDGGRNRPRPARSGGSAALNEEQYADDLLASNQRHGHQRADAMAHRERSDSLMAAASSSTSASPLRATSRAITGSPISGRAQLVAGQTFAVAHGPAVALGSSMAAASIARLRVASPKVRLITSSGSRVECSSSPIAFRPARSSLSRRSSRAERAALRFGPGAPRPAPGAPRPVCAAPRFAPAAPRPGSETPRAGARSSSRPLALRDVVEEDADLSTLRSAHAKSRDVVVAPQGRPPEP